MKRALVLCVALALAACGGKDDSASSSASLTQCFLVSMKAGDATHCDGALNLEQRGVDLAGSWQCSGASGWYAGEVSGIVDGDRVILQAWDPARPGRPLYQIDATIDRGAMRLTGDAHAVPLFQDDQPGTVYAFEAHLD
jgi:hypothetical protein